MDELARTYKASAMQSELKLTWLHNCFLVLQLPSKGSKCGFNHALRLWNAHTVLLVHMLTAQTNFICSDAG